MGKKILVQRRGRGGIQFRSPSHRRFAATSLPLETSSGAGVVQKIVHDPGRGSPLAFIEFDDAHYYMVAPEGLSEGQQISMGDDVPPNVGNIKPLGKISEGTYISNVELHPGDGGRVARSSGTYCTVVAHTPMGTEVRLPSGKSRYLNDRCRAVIGVTAASGRTEKPFVKAGSKSFLMSSRGRHWPIVKGQAMVAASHPFGGGRHKHTGKPKTISRDAPPGRKVGSIAARKTGRAKRALTT